MGNFHRPVRVIFSLRIPLRKRESSHLILCIILHLRAGAVDGVGADALFMVGDFGWAACGVIGIGLHDAGGPAAVDLREGGNAAFPVGLQLQFLDGAVPDFNLVQGTFAVAVGVGPYAVLQLLQDADQASMGIVEEIVGNGVGLKGLCPVDDLSLAVPLDRKSVV